MAITAGGSLNTVPAPKQSTLSSNYIDFIDGSTGWEQQYLPDLMEKEAEIYGKRTISGFLSQVGAEEARASDQVVWSEQGRLHLAYTGTVDASASEVTITGHIDSNATYTGGSHGLRVGDTVIVASSLVTAPCRVSAVSTDVVTCEPYTRAELSTAGIAMADGAVTVLKYGSEWKKGSDTPYSTANEPSFKSFSNKPVIIRDMYHISGSDASQIGWVEVSGEEGQNGYLWYLKADGDTRARFGDNLEMTCLEGVMVANDSTVETDIGMTSANPAGTQGLFDAIGDRGNKSSGITGVNAATDLAEFDAILAEFDKQWAI